jgi:hypothetical protein
MDLKSGERALSREIAPADRSGVSGISRIPVPRNAPGTYDYSYLRTLNELYLLKV